MLCQICPSLLPSALQTPLKHKGTSLLQASESVETSFCTRKQKRTNAALWLILINLIMKPNAVSSSFQYQVAFKMFLKVTFIKKRTSTKFWILWKPQTSLFKNRDMPSIIWTRFSWLREPVNRLSEGSRFFTEWRSSC